MLFVEASRKTKVRKLDMSTAIEEDVVRFDVTVEVVSQTRSIFVNALYAGWSALFRFQATNKRHNERGCRKTIIR